MHRVVSERLQRPGLCIGRLAGVRTLAQVLHQRIFISARLPNLGVFSLPARAEHRRQGPLSAPQARAKAPRKNDTLSLRILFERFAIPPTVHRAMDSRRNTRGALGAGAHRSRSAW
jgi:hypothetical protein